MSSRVGGHCASVVHAVQCSGGHDHRPKARSSTEDHRDPTRGGHARAGPLLRILRLRYRAGSRTCRLGPLVPGDLPGGSRRKSNLGTSDGSDPPSPGPRLGVAQISRRTLGDERGRRSHLARRVDDGKPPGRARDDSSRRSDGRMRPVRTVRYPRNQPNPNAHRPRHDPPARSVGDGGRGRRPPGQDESSAASSASRRPRLVGANGPPGNPPSGREAWWRPSSGECFGARASPAHSGTSRPPASEPAMGDPRSWAPRGPGRLRVSGEAGRYRSRRLPLALRPGELAA